MTENNVMEDQPCLTCSYNNKVGAISCEICQSPFYHTDKQSITLEYLQKSLEVAEKQNLIDTNCKDAQEQIPESFFSVTMLYFFCWINGREIKAFVDTGAQHSIMSRKCAEECGIDHLIDTRYKGVANGVGQQNISGRIWLCDIDFGDHVLPCSFIILDTLDIKVIFGLNMLISHGCIIDCKNKNMKVGDLVIPFIE